MVSRQLYFFVKSLGLRFVSQSWKRQWGYKKEKEEKHIKGLAKEDWMGRGQ